MIKRLKFYVVLDDIINWKLEMYYKIIKFVFFCFTFFALVTSKNIIPNRINEIKITKDVLFINGCNLSILLHPYRYRISNQMEQLISKVMNFFTLI